MPVITIRLLSCASLPLTSEPRPPAIKPCHDDLLRLHEHPVPVQPEFICHRLTAWRTGAARTVRDKKKCHIVIYKRVKSQMCILTPRFKASLLMSSFFLYLKVKTFNLRQLLLIDPVEPQEGSVVDGSWNSRKPPSVKQHHYEGESFHRIAAEFYPLFLSLAGPVSDAATGAAAGMGRLLNMYLDVRCWKDRDCNNSL